MQGMNWCFTYNNYMDKEEEFSDLLKKHAKYFIYGYEEGESKTPHLQGFVSFLKKHRLVSLKKLFAPQIHWELKRGTKQQAIDYCKKDGKYNEFGDPGHQGHRSDIEHMTKLATKIRKFDQLVEECPTAYRYPHSFKLLRQAIDAREAPTWRPNMIVQVFYGPARLGKTRDAVLQNPEHFILNKGNANIWFDGYDREEVLIIDDFDGWIPFRMLMNILDGNKFRGEIKGGHIWAYWTKVVITSNSYPKSWYPTQSDITPLMERITHIQEYTSFNQ